MKTGSDFIHALINKPSLIPSDAYPPSVFFLFSTNNFCQIQKIQICHLYDGIMWYITNNFQSKKLSKITGMPPLLLKILT